MKIHPESVLGQIPEDDAPREDSTRDKLREARKERKQVAKEKRALRKASRRRYRG